MDGIDYKKLSKTGDWGGDYRIVIVKSQKALDYWADVDRLDGGGKIYDTSKGDVGLIWKLENYKDGQEKMVEAPAILMRYLYDVNHPSPEAQAEIKYMDQQDSSQAKYEDFPVDSLGEPYFPLPNMEVLVRASV
eukprot:10457811-Ditylum_brightwellii.AAC.1